MCSYPMDRKPGSCGADCSPGTLKVIVHCRPIFPGLGHTMLDHLPLMSPCTVGEMFFRGEEEGQPGFSQSHPALLPVDKHVPAEPSAQVCDGGRGGGRLQQPTVQSAWSLVSSLCVHTQGGHGTGQHAFSPWFCDIKETYPKSPAPLQGPDVTTRLI